MSMNIAPTNNTASLVGTFTPNNKYSSILPKHTNLNKFTKKGTPILFLTMITLCLAAVGSYFLSAEFEAYKIEQLNTTIGTIVTYTALSLLIFELSMFAYFFILYMKYKPTASVSDALLPNISIIVPAYNEGSLVYDTLWSLANSNYPAEKMQIIAIDDGSKDDTWNWMQKAKQALGDKIDIYQQPQNKGKRHALYRGFKLGTGDIFITVDSDSVVDEATMRNLVSPLAVDHNCGAVAGNVKVLNSKEAIIPKMLQVSFAFSFEFVRSAQSTIGSVFCTPGALAAYRKDAVMNCLEQWINQTFMGKPSDIGEDRAITNMILKQGKTVKFQSNAIVYTNTPEQYKSLTKMYTRWERSNVRENLAMTNFIFQNFRNGKKSGTRLVLIQQWLRMFMAFPMLFMMVYFLVTAPLLFLTSALIGILIFSSIQALFFGFKRSWHQALWAYSYSILFTFGLFWITPYALLSAGKGGWLTRDLPQN